MPHIQTFDRITKIGINGNSSASNLVGRTDNGSEKFYTEAVFINVRSANNVSVVPTISIGTNAPNYDNICSSILLTGMTAVNKYTRASINVAAEVIAPNTEVYAKVVAGVATGITIDVSLFGFYM